MAAAKNWALTDLSESDALELVIEGDATGASFKATFDVVQFTASFALNEVPTAACLVAVGRDARSPGAANPAAAHVFLPLLTSMMKATVTFRPTGEYAPDGRRWPGDPQVIFDGYYVGSGRRKVGGKLQVILHFVHWLADLGFSSTLSANSHPANPTQLTAPAVVPQLNEAGAGGPPVYVAQHIGHEIVRSSVEDDLWAGVKAFLCRLAHVNRLQVFCGSGPGVPSPTVGNARALRALARIEGGPEGAGDVAEGCVDPGGGHHIPLALDTKGVDLVADAVADAVLRQTLDSYASITFWDALLLDFFPMFHMALAPLVDTAVVIADTPGYRTPWANFVPGEYDALDETGLLPRPLAGVAVFGGFASYTGVGITEAGAPGDPICVGGHYAPDPVAEDGVFQFIPAPSWLALVPVEGLYGAYTSGMQNGVAANTATTPADPGGGPALPPAALGAELRALYSAYAQSYYVANALRGRTGVVSGKLRFDVAPGSVVRLAASPEVGLGELDALAEDFFGCVERVTIAINAEARLAGTTFQLTDLRTATENESDRTSTAAHPLFGKNVYYGAPLVSDWNL